MVTAIYIRLQQQSDLFGEEPFRLIEYSIHRFNVWDFRIDYSQAKFSYFIHFNIFHRIQFLKINVTMVLLDKKNGDHSIVRNEFSNLISISLLYFTPFSALNTLWEKSIFRSELRIISRKWFVFSSSESAWIHLFIRHWKKNT